MKLKPVKIASRPDYPSFDAYAMRRPCPRRSFTRRAEVLLAGGVLALALEGVGDGIKGRGEATPKGIRPRGRIVSPARPAPAPEPPVPLLGDIAFPSPPVKPEPGRPEETPPLPPDDGGEKLEPACPTTMDKEEAAQTLVPVEGEAPPRLLGRPPIPPQPPRPPGRPVQPQIPKPQGGPIHPQPPRPLGEPPVAPRPATPVPNETETVPDEK